jgi:hypothetical protein
MGTRNAYTILIGKPEGKRQLKRPRHRWENNIKLDHREIGCLGVDWIICFRIGTDGKLL